MSRALPALRKLAIASGIFIGLLLVNGAGIVNDASADTPTLSANLQPILAGPWRSEENRARDRYRHPAQTLEFFGLRSDATLIEITPGGGWYTEILAPLLRDHGHYAAAIVAPEKAPFTQRNQQTKARAQLQEKFTADSAHYAGATIIEFDPNAPVFGKAGSADAVVTFRNVHNWAKAGNAEAYFKAFFAALKPGGLLGVEDHRAKAGSTLNLDSGYLPEDYVIKLATDAGFKLAARSEINANPADTKDYAKGVWTLPPTLALGDQDKAKYLAIGESDRFTLRFIKPQI
jgi:predicted methyltransferase